MNIKKAAIILGVLCGSLFQAGPVQADYLSVSEMQKIAAPIALYPDEIITEIMRASAFPEQIAQAAAWLDAHPDYSAQQLEQSWDTFTWDPSVRLLVYSPGILKELYEYPEWTAQLNQAYTAQRQALSRAIQTKRQEAWRSSKLKSDAYTEVFQDANGYIAVRARRGDSRNYSAEYAPAATAETPQKPEWNNIILGQADHEDTDSDSPPQVTTYYDDPGFFFYDDYERYTVPHDVYGRPLNPPYDKYYPYGGYDPAYYYYRNANFGTNNFNSVNGLATEANAKNAAKTIDIRNNGSGGLATAANAAEAAHPKRIDGGTTGLATAANAWEAAHPKRIDGGTTGLATAANAREAAHPKRIDGGTTGLATAANAWEAAHPKRIDGGTTGLATAANAREAANLKRTNKGTSRPAVYTAQNNSNSKRIVKRSTGAVPAAAKKSGSSKKSKGTSGLTAPVKAKKSGSLAKNNQRQNKNVNRSKKQIGSKQKGRTKNSKRIGRQTGNKQAGAVIRAAKRNTALKAAARRSSLKQASVRQRQPARADYLPAASVHNGGNKTAHTNSGVYAPSGIYFNSENSGQNSGKIVIKDGYPTSPDNDGYPTLNN